MSRKKKVLFVGSFKDKAPDGSFGGQMFACRTLINSQLKDIVDFILLDTTNESVPAPPPYKRIPKALKRVYTIIKHHLKSKIDIAIIFSSSGLSLKEKGLMVMLCKAFGAKVIFAPRSGHIKDEIAKSSFTRKFLKRVVEKADVVICQGSSWQAFYGQYEPTKPEKFRMVRNWVDTDKYSKVFDLRTQNSKPGAGPVKLLYLAWIESFKGIGDLLDVFERLRKEGLNIEADVYGNGGMFDEISQRVNNLGLADVFRLKGWADEPMKLKALAEADIFILPSYREGMPNALIESMASGLPCVSSEVGGVADLITHKENGMMFNPGDQDKLYENITYLYTNDELRQSMGSKAHQFILDKCSIGSAAGFFEDLINTI
ncbi:MAG: glycosyltransferase family 4 protein [Bacteroidetes bacterium]|nr:glycosyltransferase family 4 protein [Bacteroidota bacterium]